MSAPSIESFSGPSGQLLRLPPVIRSPEVTELQRELLRLLKGAQKAAAAEASRAGVMGHPANSLIGFAPPNDVRAIRERIRALDPDACLYESWGGAMPREERREP